MTYITCQKDDHEYFQKLREVFFEFDRNGDGLLQIEEIKDGLDSVFGKLKGNLPLFDDVIRELDQNGNNYIDYTEFLSAAASRHKLLSKENLEFVFKRMDIDRNGELSFEEIKNLVPDNWTREETGWISLFREIDQNNSESISFDEFANYMRQ